MQEMPTAAFHPAELANAALDAGITYFDTAAGYGNGQSERNYGEVLSTRRREVFLATKTQKRTYDDAMRNVEGSLKRLRTDHVDLLQLHGVKFDEDCDVPRHQQVRVRHSPDYNSTPRKNADLFGSR